MFNGCMVFLPQMEEFLGPRAEYNEEEEERKYYRRKRLGVIKNVLAASFGAMIVYSVYMGESDWQVGWLWGSFPANTCVFMSGCVNLCVCLLQDYCRCSWSSTMTWRTERWSTATLAWRTSTARSWWVSMSRLSSASFTLLYLSGRCTNTHSWSVCLCCASFKTLLLSLWQVSRY